MKSCFGHQFAVHWQSVGRSTTRRCNAVTRKGRRTRRGGIQRLALPSMQPVTMKRPSVLKSMDITADSDVVYEDSQWPDSVLNSMTCPSW